MRLKCFGCVAALFALTLGAVELQTAGELLVDLDASTLEGYSVGDNVELWPNAGTQPDFVHVNTHNKTTRPTFEIVGDVPPPVRIAIQNGMLRAWRNVSTVLFFR